MNNDLEKELTKYGFSPKESKIYIGLLKLGKVRVSELAREIKLPRTSLYLPLEELEKHGFINKIRIGNRSFWEANSPKSILRHMKENTSGLQMLLPNLENLAFSNKKTDGSELLFYKSKKGLELANSMIFKLKSNERVYSIQGSRTVEFQKQKFSTNEIIEWQTALKKSNVIGEAIVGEDVLDSIKGLDINALNAHLDRKMIAYLLPKQMMDFDAQIMVFRSTVIIMVFEKDLAIVINNKDITQVFINLIKIAESFGRKVDLNAEIGKIIENKNKN